MLDDELLSDIEAYLEEAYLPDKGIGWFVPPALTEDSGASYASPGRIEEGIVVEGKPNEYSELVSAKFDEGSKGQIKERVSFHLARSGMSAEELSAACGVKATTIAKLLEEDDYRPSKNSVLALAIGLHLNVGEAEELLAFEGHDFRRGSRFDLIVGYCLKRGIYDLDTVNQLMQRYGEAHLGA